MVFCFELKPFEQCALPGERVKNLWWFYLTDSWFSIRAGKVRLFESSSEWVKKHPGNPYLDYYYIRFLEDFFDILPQAAVETAKKNPGCYRIDGLTQSVDPDEILARLQKEQMGRKAYFYQSLTVVKNEEIPSPICWDEIRRVFYKTGLLPCIGVQEIEDYLNSRITADKKKPSLMKHLCLLIVEVIWKISYVLCAEKI